MCSVSGSLYRIFVLVTGSMKGEMSLRKVVTYQGTVVVKLVWIYIHSVLKGMCPCSVARGIMTYGG